MSPDRVVAGERSTAVGTWHADTLMSLADVGAEVRFVAVLAITEGALKLFAWSERTYHIDGGIQSFQSSGQATLHEGHRCRRRGRGR